MGSAARLSHSGVRQQTSMTVADANVQWWRVEWEKNSWSNRRFQLNPLDVEKPPWLDCWTGVRSVGCRSDAPNVFSGQDNGVAWRIHEPFRHRTRDRVRSVAGLAGLAYRPRVRAADQPA